MDWGEMTPNGEQPFKDVSQTVQVVMRYSVTLTCNQASGVGCQSDRLGLDSKLANVSRSCSRERPSSKAWELTRCMFIGHSIWMSYIMLRIFDFVKPYIFLYHHLKTVALYITLKP